VIAEQPYPQIAGLLRCSESVVRSAPLDEWGTRIDADRARLLFERGNTRIYGVAASRRERPALCLLEFVGDGLERSSCKVIEENPALGGAMSYLPVVVDGRAAIAALAADDVHEIVVVFGDGRREAHRFERDVALVPAEPWPTDLEYRNDAGGAVFIALEAEQRPEG
jgi:hypothetical protein